MAVRPLRSIAMGSAFIALLLVAITELILTVSWTPFYFRLGIPIFRKRVDLRWLPPDTAESLQDLHSGGAVVPLVFRRIGLDEVAFREAGFAFRLVSYTPVMHGLIRVEPDEGVVVITGFANWFVMAFTAVAGLMAREIQDPAFLAFLAGLLGVIYLIQTVRYAGVADSLVSLSARPN